MFFYSYFEVMYIYFYKIQEIPKLKLPDLWKIYEFYIDYIDLQAEM